MLFRYVVAERMGTIILSALVAHTAWHWMTERWSALRQFAPPAIDLVTLTNVVRWLMGIVIVAGLVWLVMTLSRRTGASSRRDDIRSSTR